MFEILFLVVSWGSDCSLVPNSGVDGSVFALELLRHELSADERLVDASQLDQLIVVAPLHDLACLHDQDLVSIADGAQSVSDDDDCLLTAIDELVKGFLNLMLTLGIKGTGGLVQQ